MLKIEGAVNEVHEIIIETIEHSTRSLNT